MSAPSVEEARDYNLKKQETKKMKPYNHFGIIARIEDQPYFQLTSEDFLTASSVSKASGTIGESRTSLIAVLSVNRQSSSGA